MMSKINTKCKNSAEFVELVGLKIMQINPATIPEPHNIDFIARPADGFERAR